MNYVRRVAVRILCVTVLGGVFFSMGCDDRSGTGSQGALQRQYVIDYKRQQEFLAAQNAEWERQSEKLGKQDVRYDAILAKWEEHAERVDVLLDRWDRVLNLLEERSRDR